MNELHLITLLAVVGGVIEVMTFVLKTRKEADRG